jgi:hypothetical protein
VFEKSVFFKLKTERLIFFYITLVYIKCTPNVSWCTLDVHQGNVKITHVKQKTLEEYINKQSCKFMVLRDERSIFMVAYLPRNKY